MPDTERLLTEAKVVALVDWPSADVPRTLVRAGFGVFSLNRLRNTAAAYAWYPERDDVPDEASVTLFEPADEGDGYLVARPAAAVPAPVDILNVFRPDDELPGLARLAIQLGAKALWLQLDVDRGEGHRRELRASPSSMASTSQRQSAQQESRTDERAPGHADRPGTAARGQWWKPVDASLSGPLRPVFGPAKCSFALSPRRAR